MLSKPFVMNIAGFDSSNGAGISADIKTFEANRVYAVSVLTALTIQNEFQIDSIQWIEKDKILKQIELQFEHHHIDYVKISLCQSLELLLELCSYLLRLNPSIRIIWDPILKSSSQFDFKIKFDPNLLRLILQKIFLITPNLDEYQQLGGKSLLELSQCEKTALLLKGGHAETHSDDILYTESTSIPIKSERLAEHYDKHGTGCVLSAVICAKLALGEPLLEACTAAKDYVKKFMLSSETRLGYHDFT